MGGQLQQTLRRRLESTIGTPFTEGNALTVLRNGDEILPAMLDAIRGATSTVDLMTFVYWRGDIAVEFARVMSARARAGVRVHLLIDALGGRLIEKSLLDDMSAAGVRVEWFGKPLVKSPFKANHRPHRKVCVVDGRVAFTGGVGIAEEWCGDARDSTEWRDTHLRVEGPAVDGLQSAFHVMLDSVQQRLRLATAYFAPDEDFLDTVCAAPGRGVEVDLLLPGPHADKRVSQLASEAAYARLVDCGVRVWTFQPSMMHAKVMTIDGCAATVGSSNFNRRSLDHDEEVVLIALDADLVETLNGHLDDDFSRSEQVDVTRWRDRSRPQRLLEGVTRPIRRWL